MTTGTLKQIIRATMYLFLAMIFSSVASYEDSYKLVSVPHAGFLLTSVFLIGVAVGTITSNTNANGNNGTL